MAYLEDDFNDDDLQPVDISDDELNAVFSVTEDGEDWDDEEGLDDGWADEDGGYEDWDAEDGDANPLDMLDDENFGERLTAVYEELKSMGFVD
jgi:hypothetical protein